jgi:hypothetical protein
MWGIAYLYITFFFLALLYTLYFLIYAFFCSELFFHRFPIKNTHFPIKKTRFPYQKTPFFLSKTPQMRRKTARGIGNPQMRPFGAAKTAKTAFCDGTIAMRVCVKKMAFWWLF